LTSTEGLPENEIEIELLPKQHDFLFSTATEKMLSGAFGSGKSRILCYDVVKHAMQPGNLVGLFRKTLTSLKATTLRVLLKNDGNLPPVLPEGSYKHNKSEHTIQIYDGGEIIYCGFDDPLRMASMNLGSAFIDEAREITEEEYVMVLGRLRNNADFCRQLGLATNPDAPTHFLYNRFFKEKDNSRAVFHSKSIDNFFLPQDYLDRLAKFTGQYRDRFVLGKWVAFEGLIFDNFSRDVHLVHRDISEFKYFVIGVDEGYQDPAVMCLFGVDGDSRMHLLKVYYRRKILQQDFVRAANYFGAELIARLRPENPIEARDWQPPDRIFVIDPSAAGLKAAFEEAGLDCVSANNAVFEGIQETRDRFALAGDGRPRLTVEPDGEGIDEWLTEIESYHRGKDEKPAKGILDHAMDATRYPAMYLKGDAPPRLYSLEKSKREDTETPAEITEENRENLYERQEAWT